VTAEPHSLLVDATFVYFISDGTLFRAAAGAAPERLLEGVDWALAGDAQAVYACARAGKGQDRLLVRVPEDGSPQTRIAHPTPPAWNGCVLAADGNYVYYGDKAGGAAAFWRHPPADRAARAASVRTEERAAARRAKGNATRRFIQRLRKSTHAVQDRESDRQSRCQVSQCGCGLGQVLGAAKVTAYTDREHDPRATCVAARWRQVTL
jgi:hypothetical protein